MTIHDPTTAPWHAKSFGHFLNDALPQLLSERLPLCDYAVDRQDTTCVIAITVGKNGHQAHTMYTIPMPDALGTFTIDGKPYTVVPTVMGEDLATADIWCVGEQLFHLIDDQLSEAPADLQWDEALLRSWLPLGERITAFITGQLPDDSKRLFGWVTGQLLDNTNWLARRAHLRRVILPLRKPEAIVRGNTIETPLVHESEVGRTCCVETPEGPNIGRILSIARGAIIRDGKFEIVDDSPAAGLGLTAGMIPCFEFDDANRGLMGANMMRQGLVRPNPEPALVQTGFEPDATDFWTGRNLLTALVSWDPGTFEDGIVLSESAAKRLDIDGVIEPGDKLANRHGTKGVVGAILPDDDMPHLPDGTPVELAFNFTGCHTRMNYGQSRELLLGRIASVEGKPLIAVPFAGLNDEQVKQRLSANGLPDDGMEQLHDAKDGEPLELRSAVGYLYWNLLHHVARGKLKSRKVTASGYLEYRHLRDLGAVQLIGEFHNTQVTSGGDEQPLVDAASQGPVEQDAFPSKTRQASYMRNKTLARLER